MKNIRLGSKALLNLLLLIVFFCVPGSGVLFGWFVIDRKNFGSVLSGKLWLITYIKQLIGRRYDTGQR